MFAESETVAAAASSASATATDRPVPAPAPLAMFGLSGSALWIPENPKHSRVSVDMFQWGGAYEIPEGQIRECLAFMDRPESKYVEELIMQQLLSKKIHIDETVPIFKSPQKRRKHHAYQVKTMQQFCRRGIKYVFAIGILPWTWALDKKWGAYLTVPSIESSRLFVMTNQAGEISLKIIRRDGPLGGYYGETTGIGSVYYQGNNALRYTDNGITLGNSMSMVRIPEPRRCKSIAQRIPECYFEVIDPPRPSMTHPGIDLSSRAMSMLPEGYMIDLYRKCAQAAHINRANPPIYVSRPPGSGANIKDLAVASGFAKLGNCPDPTLPPSTASGGAGASGRPTGLPPGGVLPMAGAPVLESRNEHETYSLKMAELLTAARNAGRYEEIRKYMADIDRHLNSPAGYRAIPAGFQQSPGQHPPEPPDVNVQDNNFQDKTAIMWSLPRMLFIHSSTTNKSKTTAAGPNDPAARFLRTATHYWATILSSVLQQGYCAMYRDHYAITRASKQAVRLTNSLVDDEQVSLRFSEAKASARQRLDREHVLHSIACSEAATAADDARRSLAESERVYAQLTETKRALDMQIAVQRASVEAAMKIHKERCDASSEYDTDRRSPPRNRKPLTEKQQKKQARLLRELLARIKREKKQRKKKTKATKREEEEDTPKDSDRVHTRSTKARMDAADDVHRKESESDDDDDVDSKDSESDSDTEHDEDGENGEYKYIKTRERQSTRASGHTSLREHSKLMLLRSQCSEADMRYQSARYEAEICTARKLLEENRAALQKSLTQVSDLQKRGSDRCPMTPGGPAVAGIGTFGRYVELVNGAIANLSAGDAAMSPSVTMKVKAAWEKEKTMLSREQDETSFYGYGCNTTQANDESRHLSEYKELMQKDLARPIGGISPADEEGPESGSDTDAQDGDADAGSDDDDDKEEPVTVTAHQASDTKRDDSKDNKKTTKKQSQPPEESDEDSDEDEGMPWDSACVPQVTISFPSMTSFRDVEDMSERGWLKPGVYARYAAREHNVSVDDIRPIPKALPTNAKTTAAPGKSIGEEANAKKKKEKPKPSKKSTPLSGTKDATKSRVAVDRDKEEQRPSKRAKATEQDSEQKPRHNDGADAPRSRSGTPPPKRKTRSATANEKNTKKKNKDKAKTRGGGSDAD